MESREAMKVTFLDHSREPRCPPNPRYPDGIDVDISGGCSITCTVSLPYPAPRCGVMVVECEKCGHPQRRHGRRTTRRPAHCEDGVLRKIG